MSRFLWVEVSRDRAGVRWSLSVQGANGLAILAKTVPLVLIWYLAFLSAQPRRIEHAPMDPLPQDIPITLLAHVDATAGVETSTIHRVEGTSWALRERPGALVFPMTPPSKVTELSPDGYSDVWRLRFAVRPPEGKRCRRAEVGFTTPQGGRVMASPQLKLIADGQMHEYVIHATQDLHPAGPGDLRIAYHCPVGTTITWGGGDMVRPNVRERWRAWAAAAE